TPSAASTCPLSLHDALPICTRTKGGSTQVPRRGFHWASIRSIALSSLGTLPRRNFTSIFPRTSRASINLLPALLPESSADDLFQDRKSTRLNSSHVKISYAV